MTEEVAELRRGVIYAATGRRYVEEAAASARSLARWHPELPTTLFTDSPPAAADAVFTSVVELPEHDWVRSEAKVWAVSRSPYEQTLYLDVDTRVCAELSGAFDLLERFDFIGVPVPQRVVHVPTTTADVPESFQNINGGVLGFRKNERTDALLARWASLYQVEKANLRQVVDQPALRYSLWESDCHICFLPPEYNVRFLKYPISLVGPVRVLHGRSAKLAAVERKVNRSDAPRLFNPALPRVGNRLLKMAHEVWAAGGLRNSVRAARRRGSGH